MATYFVGDLQGCFDEFQRLLEQVKFNPQQDKLYLVGDLVARGEKSLECLRWVKAQGSAVQTVLGNHDLHLLSTAYGIKKIKPIDKVEAIFSAQDSEELIAWLQQQPLLIHDQQHNFIVVHAGISPDWDLNTAIHCAKEVEQVLQKGNYYQLLSQMYADQPTKWHNDLQGIERLRYSINVLTRMRFCYQDGSLDFSCKAPINQAPPELKAWFELPNPLYQTTSIIFGHWASLVDQPTPSNIYALDTGCVWGNRLTLLRWEDKKLFVQPSLKA